MWWIEIRSTVRRSGLPRFVPLEDAHLHTGFRSVFCYNAQTVDAIKREGTTANLRGLPVYADKLYVDFDKSDGSKMIRYLTEQGIGFETWHSGNRSIHLHINIEPIFGAWVPAACKQWVRSIDDQADLSFYHPGGQFRLPGTFHHKNPGKCKMMVAGQHGAPLLLAEPPVEVPNFYLPAEDGEERFYTMLTGAIQIGGRNRRAWMLAVTAAESGIEYNEALTKLEWWNSKFCFPPLEPHILVKQCDSAYRRVAHR